MKKDHLPDLYGEEYFHESYENGDLYERRLRMYRQEYERIRAFVNRGSVLDVGCGLGDFMSLFSDREWARYGIDISEHALEVAKGKGVVVVLPEDPRSFFDLIVLRGSLQHLDDPLSRIKQCIDWLKPGGYLVFLATPNSGSICYRLFQDLPMLEASRNFVVFSARMLANCLLNFGMSIERIEFPYVDTPYARPVRDVLAFLLRCAGVRTRFAFWGNMMELYARKV